MNEQDSQSGFQNIDQRRDKLGKKVREQIKKGQGEEAFTTTGKSNWEKRRKKRKSKEKKEPKMKTKMSPETREFGRKKVGIIGGIIGISIIVALLSPEAEANTQANQEAKFSEPQVRDANSSEDDSVVKQESLIGRQVVVTSTGPAGLVLRKGPGKEYEMNDSAWDGDVFTVIGGPKTADGYTWWQIKEPMTGTVSWAAARYLSP